MKKVVFYALALTSLVFTSCSTETNDALELQKPQNLLKTFSIERNVEGRYFTNTSAPSTNVVVNDATKTNEVYVSNGNGALRQNNTDLVFNDGRLKVDFIQEATSNPSITIFDDKETLEINYLKTYKISANENGEYQVDFEVNKGISVDFVFNKETKVYEIHLAKGMSSNTNFTKVFPAKKGDVIKLSFVNHLTDDSLRTSYRKKEKPRSIILT